MLAADRETVHELGCAARERRVDRGEIPAAGIEVASGQTIGVGDEIITLRNDRAIRTSLCNWVANGDRWTVQAVNQDGSLICGGEYGNVRLPADYAEQHAALAYATTVHKAQGITVDRAIAVLDPDVSAETAYVALTRGQLSNTALLRQPFGDDDGHAGVAVPVDAKALLAAIIERPRNPISATEAMRQAATDNLGVLRALTIDTERRVNQAAGPDRRDTIDRLRSDIHRYANSSLEADAPRFTEARQAFLDALGQQDARDAWLQAHPEVAAYVDDLQSRTLDRHALLADRTLADPSGPILKLLGEPPATEPAFIQWMRAAEMAVAYAETYGVDVSAIETHVPPGEQGRAQVRVDAASEVGVPRGMSPSM